MTPRAGSWAAYSCLILLSIIGCGNDANPTQPDDLTDDGHLAEGRWLVILSGDQSAVMNWVIDEDGNGGGNVTLPLGDVKYVIRMLPSGILQNCEIRIRGGMYDGWNIGNVSGQMSANAGAGTWAIEIGDASGTWTAARND